MINLEHPYLGQQLFAYIGNKRALLPFLHESFRSVLEEAGIRGAIRAGSRNSAGQDFAGIRFLDPFAGTGASSRLARLMGMDVHANDWELYSRVYNSAFLQLDIETAQELFAGEGGLRPVIDRMNRLGNEASRSPGHKLARAYFSLHYAPECTAHADYRRERLFYTAENARFLDAVRQAIADEYGDPLKSPQAALLLSLLVYEAGTHANTSGVFKACHKGFGGHGGDALGRIMGPMELEYPQLPGRSQLPQNQRIQVSAQDALKLGGSYDLVYLDPPYNGHQYGSNYFMLNSLVRWDHLPVDESRRSDGSFMKKAGIRPDWSETRSDFCSIQKAPAAFSTLLDSLDAPRILLSYNTEGIIPFDQLVDMMAAQGRVRILTRDYVTFRGGRQSNERKTRNLEFILALDRSRSMTQADHRELQRVLAQRRLERTLGGKFYPSRLSSLNGGIFHIHNNGTQALEIKGIGKVQTPLFFEIDERGRDLIRSRAEILTVRELDAINSSLEKALIPDHLEVIRALIRIISSDPRSGSSRRLGRKLFEYLRKVGFKKYRTEFFSILEEIRTRTNAGEFPDFNEDIEKLLERVGPRL